MTYCNDYGDAPDCLGVPDPQFTMHFDDVGETPILWCARCGPKARAMGEAIFGAAAVDPGFAAELEAAIAKAEAELVHQ